MNLPKTNPREEAKPVEDVEMAVDKPNEAPGLDYVEPA